VKRFFTTLVIIIAGGAAFFAGWAQFMVPVDSVAVLQSKTHGLDENPVRPGEFRWIWYKLIPGNVTSNIFRIKPESFSFDADGELPQADTYSALTGLKSNFLWEVSGNLEYSINDTSLPLLVTRGGIDTQEKLDTYLEKLKTNLKNYTIQRIDSYFKNLNADSGEKSMEEISIEGYILSIKRDIQNSYPFITPLVCNITVKKTPDFALYKASRDLYQNYIDRQKMILENEVALQAEKHLSSEFRFNELLRYGELLTKYPVLLKYLEIEGNSTNNETQ
jgi:hypothetical protein